MERFNDCVASAHEIIAMNNADFVVVKWGGSVQEYEIKVSRADLIGEMRCARVARGLDNATKYYKKAHLNLLEMDNAAVHEELANKHGHGTSLSKTKLTKHKLYLTKPKDREQRPEWAHKDFVPNTFYWCIPYAFLDICMELNQGLPYGIYVFDVPIVKNPYDKTYIYKRASSLGAQDNHNMYHMANRLHVIFHDMKRERDLAVRSLENYKRDHIIVQ